MAKRRQLFCSITGLNPGDTERYKAIKGKNPGLTTRRIALVETLILEQEVKHAQLLDQVEAEHPNYFPRLRRAEELLAEKEVVEPAAQEPIVLTPNKSDNIKQSTTEFAPTEVPQLVDRRGKKDLAATAKGKEQISGGEQEGRVTDPTAKKQIFDKVEYTAGLSINLVPKTVQDRYAGALNKIKVTRTNTNYAGAHHNGGIVLQGKWDYAVPIAPNIVAHELGHASHSLLGEQLNSNPAVLAELQAVESLLYPDLRTTVTDAIADGKKLSNNDIEFFNYLLSPEELIAEFNVFRLADSEQAAQIAPVLSQLLESVEQAPNLVVDRKTFPSGYGTIVVKANETFDGDYTKLNAYMRIAKERALKRGKKEEAAGVATQEPKVKKKAEAGAKEPSPAEVLKKGKPKGPGAAPSGVAKLRKTTKPSKEEPKAEVEVVEEEEGKLVGQEEPQSFKREEQQPADIEKPVSKKALEAMASGQEYDVLITNFERGASIDLFVETLETTKSMDEFDTATEGLLSIALFEHRKMVKGKPDPVTQRAIDLLYDSELFAVGRPYDALVNAFLGFVQGKTSPRYVQSGKITPWADFALKRGLIPQAHKVASTAPLGGDKIPEIAKLIERVTNDADVATSTLIKAVDDVSATPAVREAVSILNNIEATTSIPGVGITVDAAKAVDRDTKEGISVSSDTMILESLFKSMTEKEKAFKYKHVPLSKWFTARGKLKLKPMQVEKGIDRELVDHPTLKVLDRPEGATPSTNEHLKDADAPPKEGKSSRYDGPVIKKPMSLGNVKTHGSRILRKFNKRLLPKVEYYTSLADLKRKDPKLFAEANRSRTDKLPIPDNAAGYSFGNRVLIFSENIKHRHHLAFVLSHEIIGHFGLGSIMQTAQFNQLMDDIYKTDGMVRADADILIDLHGMSKREATEEALADLAGVLDNSIIARIVYAIRTFFKRLRLDHTDDMTRYFIHHSRRYVRTGSTSDVSAVGVYANFKTLEQRHIEGRASTSHVIDGGFVVRNTTWMPSVNSTWERFENAVTRIKTREGIEANSTAIKKLIGLGLEQVQSFGNMGNRSPGIRAIGDIFREESEDIRTFLSITDEMMKYSFTANLIGLNQMGLGGGPTVLETKQGSELAGINALDKSTKADERTLDKAPSLVRIDSNGRPVIDNRVYNPKLPKSGMNINGGVIKAQAFGQDVKLGDYDVFDATTNNKLRKDIESGKLRRQLVDEKTGKLAVDDKDKPITVTYKPKFLVGGKIPENEWRIHNELRASVDAAALNTMITKIEGTLAQKNTELRLLGVNNPQFKDEDIAILREIADIYADIFDTDASLSGAGMTWVSANREKAETFLYEVTRAFHEKAKLDDWVKGNPKNVNPNTRKPEGSEEFRNDLKIRLKSGSIKTFKTKQLISKLQQIHNRKVSKDAASQIQGSLAELHTLGSQAINAEFYAKRSIMGAYVHFGRRGTLQVSVRARKISKKGKRGAVIKLSELLDNNLPYFRTNSMGVAEEIVADLNKDFKFGTPIEMADEFGDLVTVELFATIEESGTKAPLLDTINYDEFIQTLIRVNINITPQERERLVQTLASSHSSARSNLMRSGTPGWDPDLVRSTAEHLERQAHIAGKNKHNHRIAETMADREKSLWFGSQDVLDAFVERVRIAEKVGNPHALFMAEKALAEYQHQMLHSSGSDGFQVKQRDGTYKTFEGKGKANRYKDVVADALAFRNQNPDTMAGLDSKVDKLAGPMMEWTALVQLGLALAPGMVNLTSIGTHAGPLLATYNKKTGYGGGFGLGPSYVALAKASRDMNIFGGRLGNAPALAKIVKDGTWAKYGMRGPDEAQFLLNETLSGVFTPNMTNMLVGTSRAGRHSNTKSKVISLGMTVFSKSEQFNRRVVGVTAYRLQKARMLASGDSRFTEAKFNDPTSLASTQLANFAIQMVNTSQGEYAAYNRPSWAKSGIGKVLFTYKLFVVITIELMANLALREKLFFLGMLIFMAGIKGLPFADDLLDLIDTLKQKFGLKSQDAEVLIVQFFDDLVPGLGVIMMRGVVDYVSGTTGSTRFGHGDLIPGSGAFKAGSDTGRELKNIAGPVASAYSGIIGSTALTAKYLAEVVGLRRDVTTIPDILRQGFGSAGIKGLTEGFIYMSDGSITNTRGQVISKEVGILDVVFRMLGFYPGIATRHNDVTRLSQSARNYAQEIKIAFINAALIASARGDRPGVNAIRQEVREFNREVRGTQFFIPNFPMSLTKAIRASKHTVSQRQLKSLPRAIKPLQKRLMGIYGLSTQ